jgi:hypothetical protein
MRSIPLILFVAVLARAQIARQANGAVVSQPPPPTSFDCSADGTVVNSITGEPIARAHVNVIPNGAAGYSTVTDSSGKWALSNMGCAAGVLQVTRPGFLQNTPNSRTGGPFRRLTLISGSPVHDLKTELTPQSVAFGKVLDDQGDPVMGAQITGWSSHVVDGRSRFQQAGLTTTNDLGEYRIPNLPRGKYVLCVHMNPPNGTMQLASQTIAADTCYPGPLEGGAASAMDLPAGRESKVDFTLNEVPAVHVRGSVTGLPEGRGSGINLVKRGADLGGNYANVPGAVRDGKFDFRVPPGSYMLSADYFDAGKRLTARVPVDAAGSDIDNIVVHLDSGFTVTGVVRAESQSGRTTPPQFGVNLRPSEPGSNTGQMKWEPDHTSFAINEMVPGSFRLEANPPAPFYVKSATLAGQDILNNEVPISQSAGPIEILLRDDGGSIEGDVVDANGQPVSAGIMLLRGTIRVANLMSQPSGHFKIQNVAPGDYTIYAWDDPNEVEYADPDWMRRNGGGGTAVTVTAAQNQQIKLTWQLVPQL